MTGTNLDAVSRALKFVGALTGIAAAAIEPRSALANAHFVAERGLHDFFQ